MPNFLEHPGLLFVLATVLPLVSFLLIFLASGGWCIARRYRNSPGMEGLYQLFGGDKPGKTPALIALAAIGLAFVCSATGFVLHYKEEVDYHHEHEELHKAAHDLEFKKGLTQDKKAREKLEEEVQAAEDAVQEREKTWEKRRAEAWKGT